MKSENTELVSPRDNSSGSYGTFMTAQTKEKQKNTIEVSTTFDDENRKHFALMSAKTPTRSLIWTGDQSGNFLAETPDIGRLPEGDFTLEDFRSSFEYSI